MRQQPECLTSLPYLFFHLPVQFLDPLLQLSMQTQQLIPPLTRVGRQRQSPQRPLSCLAPQTSASSQCVIERDCLQCVLHSRPDLHPLMTVAQQGSQIPLFG
jgi:hypothetical protein